METSSPRKALTARFEHRGRCGVPLGDQHGQAVQEEIGGARRRPAPGHGPRRLGDLQHTAAVGQTTDDDRGPQRVQVGLARERDVERLEPLGGLEQQRRRVAAAAHDEGDLGAEEVDAGALELVERSGLRRGQQSEGRVGRAGLVRGLRRGQRALRLGAPVPGVSSVARSRKAAAAARPPRACARSAERSSSDATSSSGPARVRAVPGAAIGIDVRVGGLGQRAVRRCGDSCATPTR